MARRDTLKNPHYTAAMTSVLEIEEAIKKLPEHEYTQLREWIEDYELEQGLLASSARIAQMLDEEESGESQLIDEGQ